MFFFGPKFLVKIPQEYNFVPSQPQKCHDRLLEKPHNSFDSGKYEGDLRLIKLGIPFQGV